jgi:purine-binding chemotaxis protein CheW
MSDPTPISVLTFDLQGEIFAIEATRVREILDPGPVTEVPGASAHLDGLINVRGRVVPLADLRPQFGMEPRAATADSRFIVIEAGHGAQAVAVGLRADKVFEVTDLAAGDLEEAPRIGMHWPPELIRWIGRRGADFVVVLDIDRVFA